MWIPLLYSDLCPLPSMKESQPHEELRSHDHLSAHLLLAYKSHATVRKRGKIVRVHVFWAGWFWGWSPTPKLGVVCLKKFGNAACTLYCILQLCNFLVLRLYWKLHLCRFLLLILLFYLLAILLPLSHASIPFVVHWATLLHWWGGCAPLNELHREYAWMFWNEKVQLNYISVIFPMN